jgi:hypothetical protein
MRLAILVAAAAAAVLGGAGCVGGDTPELPARPRANVLIRVPVMDSSFVRDTTGTPEAQRWELYVHVPLDSVRRFYRANLNLDGWSLQSDEGDSLRVTMHARRDSALVWVIAEREPAGRTQYTLIGSIEQPGVGPQMMQRPR